AATPPTTCKPPRPCNVTSKLASSRGKAASSACLATAARACASATRSKWRPLSGTSLSASGTLQRRSALRSDLVIALSPSISRRAVPVRDRETRAVRARIRPERPADARLRGHRPPAARPARVPSRRQIHCGLRPRQAVRHWAPPAPPDTLPAGHKKPLRSYACFAAPRDRPPPFRACCRPCPGRTGQTTLGQGRESAPPRPPD